MNLFPPYGAYSYNHLVAARENIARVLQKRLPAHVSRHLAIELIKLDKEIKRRKYVCIQDRQ